MTDPIEMMRAKVRPILIIFCSFCYFVFGFSDIPVRPDVVETFKWILVGLVSEYVPERAYWKWKNSKLNK